MHERKGYCEAFACRGNGGDRSEFDAESEPISEVPPIQGSRLLVFQETALTIEVAVAQRESESDLRDGKNPPALTQRHSHACREDVALSLCSVELRT